MHRISKPSTDPITNPRRTSILITLLTAAFLSSMSTAVTGTMIPNFTEYFGISSALAQWLTSGAALVSGITMPMTSFIIKKLPDRVYFLFAMTAFTAGSLAAILTNSFPLLLVSRLVQAFGCGLLLPFVQVVLLRLYPKERHGFIMGAYAMSSMVSAAAAPTLAGLILDQFGWRGVFVSLGMGGGLVLLGGMFLMQSITEKETTVLKYSHVLVSASGFTAFLIGVNNLRSGLLSLKSGGMALAGALLLGIFIHLQLKTETPMLNLRVFRHPPFRTAVLLNLFLYLITMGNAVILPIFTKEIRGFSDTAYGLAALGGSVISVFISLYAGRQFDHTGVKPMFIAGVGLFGAFSVTGLFLSQNTPIWYIAIVSALQSTALAALNSPATAMALSGLEGQERIDGSAIYNTLRQIASSLGSTLSVLLYTLLGSNIPAIHDVFRYYGILTAAIACTELAAVRSLNRKLQNA